MAARTGNSRTAVVLAIVIAMLLATLVGWQESQRLDPQSKIEMEAAIGKEFLAYAVWDGSPLAVFEFAAPMHLFDGVCLDQMHLDWLANGVRFVPEWELSGGWSCVDRTNNPASAGYARGWWGDVLYGQINDPSIAIVEAFVNGDWVRYPVAAPGYLVRMGDDAERPDEYRFLDVSGVVVWTIDLDDEDE